MWFVKIEGDTPDEKARNYVKYIMKASDMSERDAAILELESLVKNHKDEISRATYNLIVSIKYDRLNYWIAMFGPEWAIDALLENVRNYSIHSNIIKNRNAKIHHLEKIKEMADDSPVSQANLRAIKVRYRYLTGQSPL